MKKTIIILAAVMILLLAGCKGGEERLENRILRQSDIPDSEAYQQYELYAANGQVDANGYYVEEQDATEEPEGSIQVSFAENNHLTAHYYSDDSLQSELLSPCYLEPGMQLFATLAVNSDAYSAAYQIAGFRVCEYDEIGNRVESSVLTMAEVGQTEDGLAVYEMDIPADYACTNIALEPLGDYTERTIQFSAVCEDAGGNSAIGGTWTVNDSSTVGDSISISPLVSYIVDYQFDP